MRRQLLAGFARSKDNAAAPIFNFGKRDGKRLHEESERKARIAEEKSAEALRFPGAPLRKFRYGMVGWICPVPSVSCPERSVSITTICVGLTK